MAPYESKNCYFSLHVLGLTAVFLWQCLCCLNLTFERKVWTLSPRQNIYLLIRLQKKKIS